MSRLLDSDVYTDRESLGSWDVTEKWCQEKHASFLKANVEWLRRNVLGGHEIPRFIYRVEFWDEHYDPRDRDRVIHRARIFSFFDKDGHRIHARSCKEPGHYHEKLDEACMNQVFDIALTAEVPEDLR